MNKETLLNDLECRLEVAESSICYLEENYVTGQIDILKEVIERIKEKY